MNKIDRLICERVLKHKFFPVTHGPCCTCQTCGQLHDDCKCEAYSTEDYYAAGVVNFMESAGYNYELNRWEGNSLIPPGRMVTFRKDGHTWSEIDKTFSMAVCLAALRTTGMISAEIDALRSE